MPRRKQYKILTGQTAIQDAFVSELQKNPELADYDIETIEILVKKKITPHIRSIDKAKDNLKRYIAVNKEFIQIVNDEAIVSKKETILSGSCGTFPTCEEYEEDLEMERNITY